MWLVSFIYKSFTKINMMFHGAEKNDKLLALTVSATCLVYFEETNIHV